MRRRRAYILPMTLTLLSLAALAMAGVSRRCLNESLQVGRDYRNLQDKWAILSCQTTLLNETQRILGNRKASSARVELRFGGRTFQILLADEQAKINLNTIDRLRGRAEVDRLVRDAKRSSGATRTVRLRPMARPPRFIGFGQVFDDAGTPADAREIRQATAAITCWGDGRLNYRQASESTIRMLVWDDPDLAARILQLRQTTPILSQSLTPMNLKNRNGIVIDELLTDTSSCFSTWVEMTDSYHGFTSLGVIEAGVDGRTRVARLSW